MSIFNRVFKVTQSEAHAVIDKIEDPIKMTEQGIRDLKKDLQQAMTSLAEVKGMAIRTRRSAESSKKLAADYERKAMTLLQKMQNGELDSSEAERLATQALNKKEHIAAEAVRLSQEAERHEQMANQLQANVNKIKSTITTYENDLITLKARAKTPERRPCLSSSSVKSSPSKYFSNSASSASAIFSTKASRWLATSSCNSVGISSVLDFPSPEYM